MTAPHIRDLDLPDWHEVPAGAIIPAGTRYISTFPSGGWVAGSDTTDYHASDRPFGVRYFTAEPIPYPSEEEIETEAKRMWEIVYVRVPWAHALESTRDDFRTLAADSLDRQNKVN